MQIWGKARMDSTKESVDAVRTDVRGTTMGALQSPDVPRGLSKKRVREDDTLSPLRALKSHITGTSSVREVIENPVASVASGAPNSVADYVPHGPPWRCELCMKEFTLKRNLKRHVRLHDEAEATKYKCDWVNCGKTFARASDYNDHRNTHEGIKPHVCKVCKKRFVRNSDLKLHQRRHEKQKPYACMHCNRAFLRSCDLTAHMRRRHHNDTISQGSPPAMQIPLSIMGAVSTAATSTVHPGSQVPRGIPAHLVHSSAVPYSFHGGQMSAFSGSTGSHAPSMLPPSGGVPVCFADVYRPSTFFPQHLGQRYIPGVQGYMAHPPTGFFGNMQQPWQQQQQPPFAHAMNSGPYLLQQEPPTPSLSVGVQRSAAGASVKPKANVGKCSVSKTMKGENVQSQPRAPVADVVPGNATCTTPAPKSNALSGFDTIMSTATVMSEECPWSDCSCGIRCTCRSECKCGTLPKSADDWAKCVAELLELKEL
eukprot:m.157378 g.157378  ORF g.157378 m.157378 type:complete len:482 (-) comp17968_c0_seq1:18-1463(-)